jgi:pimeloyl-ACP methyl ester carboxylesterase
MDRTHHIYLVPGFFGFANLGEFSYFSHPDLFLRERFAREGIPVRIVRVHTLPTASLRKRAETLARTILDTDELAPEDPVHLVGHSTGGLDARLLVSPGVSLGEDLDIERIVSQVETVVTVATPHHGTPLASFFGSSMGQPLLRLLSLATVYTLRFGHLPLSFLLKLAGLLFRLDNAMGWKDTIVDQLFGQLLEDFSPDRRMAVSRFFQEVRSDQALVFQLTPDSMDVFNTSTTDRPSVRYGSVVTRGRSPGLGARLACRLDPYAHVTHTAYDLLHRFTARMSLESVPPPKRGQARALSLAYGRVPRPKANDGIVPTLSQAWGQIIKATEADHLDIIGHFGDRSRTPPHVDWLASGSEFDRIDFEDTWSRVAEFLTNRQKSD